MSTNYLSVLQLEQLHAYIMNHYSKFLSELIQPQTQHNLENLTTREAHEIKKFPFFVLKLFDWMYKRRFHEKKVFILLYFCDIWYFVRNFYLEVLCTFFEFCCKYFDVDLKNNLNPYWSRNIAKKFTIFVSKMWRLLLKQKIMCLTQKISNIAKIK